MPNWNFHVDARGFSAIGLVIGALFFFLNQPILGFLFVIIGVGGFILSNIGGGRGRG